MKLILFGLDGGSIDLIKKFADLGKLPNFRKLLANDKIGTLFSTTPPHTAPGWVSAFTGFNPGEHGVFQFWDTQSEKYIGKFMGKNDWGAPSVWELLNSYGIKTAVINVPMSHPPTKLDGIILTWPLSNTLNYAYPKNILYEIAQINGHYASDLNTMFQGDIDQYILKALEISKKRLVTLKYLLNEFNYGAYISVFTEIDRVSHFYWNYMDKESPYYVSDDNLLIEKAIEHIYEEIDMVLGEIIHKLSNDTLLMIISDHGFQKGELNFYVQSYLIQKGFLKIRESNIQQKIKDHISPNHTNGSWFEYISEGIKYEVDWTNTYAYMAAPGSYGINVNLKGRQTFGIVENEKYELVKSQLINVLSEVSHPVTGNKIFKNVVRREDIYKGKNVHKAPDIILVPYSYGIMVHHEIVPGLIFGEPEQKGMHGPNGIYALYGKDAEGFKASSAAIEDITPTILNYFGIRCPYEFDGKPIYEFNRQILNEPNINASYETSNSLYKADYTESELTEINKKLESLGYL